MDEESEKVPWTSSHIELAVRVQIPSVPLLCMLEIVRKCCNHGAVRMWSDLDDPRSEKPPTACAFSQKFLLTAGCRGMLRH